MGPGLRMSLFPFSSLNFKLILKLFKNKDKVKRENEEKVSSANSHSHLPVPRLTWETTKRKRDKGRFPGVVWTRK